MTPAALSAIKSSRVSCARVLARHMIEQRWRIERIAYDCGADGLGRARYAVTMGRHRISYISRTFRWDGIEKIGRRSDGA
ncbi:MAG: hypothetical protein FJX52_11920, partial [Alphaproteobacteria bacterium]|nr:hypothetical protein [Alphaproteobacteria bacterium]